MRLRIAAAIIGLWACGTSMLALQPREEYVGLGVSFLTGGGQAYPATTEGGNVFYEGEPVRARVVLVNQTPQLVQLNERRGPWADAGLAFHVSTSKEKSAVATHVKVTGSRLAKAERAGSSLTLEPAGSEEVVFEVNGEDGRPLAPGDYTLRAVLEPSALEIAGAAARRIRQEFDLESTFVVAPILSRGDQMNYLLHMAAIHRVAGNQAEAEAWLEKLLRINPTSIPAFIQRGALRRAAKNCSGAVESWSRALQLANAGADSEALIHNPQIFDEFRANLQRLIARCETR